MSKTTVKNYKKFGDYKNKGVMSFEHCNGDINLNIKRVIDCKTTKWKPLQDTKSFYREIDIKTHNGGILIVLFMEPEVDK